MSLIEKITNQQILNKNAKYESSFVLKDYESLMVKINKVREILQNLSALRDKNQSDERYEQINHLCRILEYIKNNYESYLCDLHDLNNFLKINPNIKLKSKIKTQVDEALKTKSKIINHFETIYKNFKNTAKNINAKLPLNMVLSKMQECFYFNNTEQETCQNNKYYDSTTMQIRHILY